jgi:hypothetical protein
MVSSLRRSRRGGNRRLSDLSGPVRRRDLLRCEHRQAPWFRYYRCWMRCDRRPGWAHSLDAVIRRRSSRVDELGIPPEKPTNG